MTQESIPRDWMAGGLILFFVFSSVAIIKMKRDYIHFGKLSTTGAVMQILAFCIHGAWMSILLWNGFKPKAVEFNWASGAGAVLALAGLGIVLAAMLSDFDLRKWLGMEAGGLETGGLYAWSRNPQFIGYGLFLVGLSLIWWNGYDLVGLLFYGLFVNELSRLEEAHLADIFGETYLAYRARVPRFLFNVKIRKTRA